MNVLVASDGSKHGKWTVAWLAKLPFISPPTLRVLHVVDVAGLRAPFIIQPVVVGTDRYVQAELKRMEAAAANIVRSQSIETLRTLRLTGTVTIDRGAVADTIIRHAKRGVGLVSVGS